MSDMPPSMPPQYGAVSQRPKTGRGWKIFSIILILMLVVSIGGNLLLGIFSIGMLFEGMDVSPSAHIDQEMIEKGEREKVAVIPASGEVGEDMVERLRKLIAGVEEDHSVVAVVVEVDSPGGGITAADEIHHMLTELAQKYPLYISMRSLAASGGYYISMPARKIYAQPTSLVGSIGVIWPAFEASRLLDKIGITPEVITSDEALYKDAGAPYRKFSDSDRAYIKGLVNDAHQKFRQIVSDGRKGKLNEPIEKIAVGRIWPATKAHEMGLVDEIGYLKDACKDAAAAAGHPDATIVRIHERVSLLDALGISARKPSVQIKISPSMIYELHAAKGEYRYAPGLIGE